MNYMEQVAEMLGVELNEEFKLLRLPEDECETRFWLGEPLSDTFKVTEEGLIRIKRPWSNDEMVDHDLLPRIFIGEWVIVKIPWKPKKDEMYHFIDPQGGIFPGRWHSDFCDIALYAMGNCFRTKAEAEAHKDEMLKKMKEVMGE